MTDVQDTNGELPSIDSKTYWMLLSARPTAVPIVAARDENGPKGLLALSATHVSASPPSMLVAVGRSTSALSTIKNAGCFGISYLAENAADTAKIFGGQRGIKGGDRFVAEEWSTLVTGAPVFQKASVVFDCIIDQIYEYNDTDLVIGRLIAYSVSPELRPLVVRSGNYVSWPF